MPDVPGSTKNQVGDIFPTKIVDRAMFVLLPGKREREREFKDDRKAAITWQLIEAEECKTSFSRVCIARSTNTVQSNTVVRLPPLVSNLFYAEYRPERSK